MNEEPAPTQSDNSTAESGDKTPTKFVEEMKFRFIRNDDPVIRSPHRVLSEAGLFKNGQQYSKGDLVELDAKTAASFIELGEVEEVVSE